MVLVSLAIGAAEHGEPPAIRQQRTCALESHRQGVATNLGENDRAHKRVLAREPGVLLSLEMLCREYVELKRSGADPARLLVLQTEIQVVDSTILSNRRGPALICAICLLYYRMRLDCVAVAMDLKVSPQMVRQVLARMNQVAKRLKDGDPPAPPPGPRPRAGGRPRKARSADALERRRDHGREYQKKWREAHREETRQQRAASDLRRKEKIVLAARQAADQN